MTCVSPIKLEDLTVPCGKCVNCQLAIAKNWSTRMLHENVYWDSAVFVTLTYNDDHLPDPPSLDKSSWQRYVKRLRKLLGGRPLKYFAVGEYGHDRGRPHMHAIVFGLGIQEHTLTHNGHCVKGPALTAWDPRGFVQLDTVNESTVHYVASYLLKKNKTPLGLAKPWRLMSKGLGKRYVLSNTTQLARELALRRGGIEGKNLGLPRYYVKKLREIYDDDTTGSFESTPIRNAIEAKGAQERLELEQELAEMGIKREHMFPYLLHRNRQKRRNNIKRQHLKD